MALALAAALAGCASEEDTILDEAEDVAVGDKSDGDSYTPCQLGAVVTFLNEGATVAELKATGIHQTAAEHVVAHRDGADRQFGTADDNLFDDVAEFDAVPYIGPRALAKLVAATEERCAPTPGGDPWADARDVNKATVKFPAGTAAPPSYTYPESSRFNLGGTEFWQKWEGGHNPTYSYSQGTDAGKLCMQASAIRFEEIMKNPPAELVALLEGSNWRGSFFNWNDDYSQAEGDDASGAMLWAWRTSLMKWISQTGRDGTCHLPTRGLVIRAATECTATASRANGETEGCEAQ
jgi:hypothetical protein